MVEVELVHSASVCGGSCGFVGRLAWYFLCTVANQGLCVFFFLCLQISVYGYFGTLLYCLGLQLVVWYSREVGR